MTARDYERQLDQLAAQIRVLENQLAREREANARLYRTAYEAGRRSVGRRNGSRHVPRSLSPETTALIGELPAGLAVSDELRAAIAAATTAAYERGYDNGRKSPNALRPRREVATAHLAVA